MIIEGLFPYADGTYYGIGEGYVSDITVAVEIKGKTIRSISIVEHEDDAAFMTRAVKILDNVVANQTTEVDVISGATFSSEGILEAINNALKEAEKVTNGESEEDSKEDTAEDTMNQEKPKDESGENTDAPETDSDEEEKESLYIDGEYTATVVCQPDEFEDFEAYNLSVTIVVKDDKIIEIKDITGDGDEGNDRYIEWAVNGRSSYTGIVAQILNNGMITDEIDVVSRATCTSKSMVEACESALEQAKAAEKEPEEPKEPVGPEEEESEE